MRRNRRLAKLPITDLVPAPLRPRRRGDKDIPPCASGTGNRHQARQEGDEQRRPFTPAEGLEAKEVNSSSSTSGYRLPMWLFPAGAEWSTGRARRAGCYSVSFARRQRCFSSAFLSLRRWSRAKSEYWIDGGGRGSGCPFKEAT